MKRSDCMTIALILTTVLSFTLTVYASKDIFFDEQDIIDTEKIFDNNEIFFKTLKGIEYDDSGHLYFLAGHFVRIFKVKADTFKLVKTLSSKGSGPGELQMPFSFRIKNGKIFVFDMGFGGVKIFDLEGKILKEFKIPVQAFTFNQALNRQIDVSSKEEVFVRHIDEGNNTIISVFDTDGKKIRQIVSLGTKRFEDMRKWFKMTNFEFLLDPKDNVIILFKQGGRLEKYSPSGSMMWGKNLYDDFPADLSRKKDSAVKRTKGHLTITNWPDFYGLCNFSNEEIFISGHKCGMIYDLGGKCLMKIRLIKEEWFGTSIAFFNDKLYSKDKIFDFKKIRRNYK